MRQDNNNTIQQTVTGLPDVSGGDFRIGDLLVAADQYASQPDPIDL